MRLGGAAFPLRSGGAAFTAAGAAGASAAGSEADAADAACAGAAGAGAAAGGELGEGVLRTGGALAFGLARWGGGALFLAGSPGGGAFLAFEISEEGGEGDDAGLPLKDLGDKPSGGALVTGFASTFSAFETFSGGASSLARVCESRA